MVNIIRKELYDVAGKLKEYVEKNYAVPSEINGLRHGTYTYLFCQATYKGNSSFPIKAVGMANQPVGDNLNHKIYKSDYINIAKKIVAYVDANGKLPNYAVWNGKRIHEHLYEYMFAKIIDYYYWNRQLPAYVVVNSDALVKPSPKKSYSEELFDYFCSKFGKPSCIDDAIESVQNHGYGGYYDDHMTNYEVVDALARKGGQKPNCTDIHQLFWHIGRVLGYDVRAVHVWCTSSDVGHVRLDFKKSNTGWFSRDVSAVADGECVECVWCRNGEFLAYNPNWFLSNVNR